MTYDAVQVLGGQGYMKDHPSSATTGMRATEIYEGTSEMQRLVLSRSIMRELAAPVGSKAPGQWWGRGVPASSSTENSPLS